MTSAIQVKEIPIETTFAQIREMTIPDARMVEEFAHAALRSVRMALAENSIYSAIDTMEKTKLVEDYIRSKVHRQQATLQTENMIAADRYEMIWEIGGWLDGHVLRPSEFSTDAKGQFVPTASRAVGSMIKFTLKEIGINEHQSKGWQSIWRNKTLEELRSWCDGFKKDGIELRWGLLWNFAVPKSPKQEEEFEVELSEGGKKIYKAMKAYFEYTSKNDITLREYIFIAGMFRDAATKLESVTKIPQA